MHPIDIVFWACLMLGGAYTLMTLLLGGLGHGAGHVHHVGSLHLPHGAHIAGHHAGHLPAGHTGPSVHGAQPAHGQVGQHPQGASQHHAESEEAGSGFNLLAYLNPMAVAGFLLGFGGAGVISGLLAPTLAAGVRILLATASGWGLWLCAYLVATRVFGNAETTSHNVREDLIGLHANVTAPIDGTRPGMVSYTVAGARQTVRAITDADEAIPTGTVVQIRKIEDNTAYVLRVD